MARIELPPQHSNRHPKFVRLCHALIEHCVRCANDKILFLCRIWIWRIPDLVSSSSIMKRAINMDDNLITCKTVFRNKAAARSFSHWRACRTSPEEGIFSEAPEPSSTSSRSTRRGTGLRPRPGRSSPPRTPSWRSWCRSSPRSQGCRSSTTRPTRKSRGGKGKEDRFSWHNKGRSGIES